MAELEEQPHGGALYRPAKGETANPNGRPKGVKSFKRILKEILKEATTITDITGQLKTLTNKEAMMLLLVRDAVNEDEDPNVRMKALNIVMEKIDGKAVVKADINHKNNGDMGGFDPKKLSIEELRTLAALTEKANNSDE